ncbi:acetyl-CoA carboxylase biotin carboxyl carrier protein [Falsiroseomonas sp. E2-1-a20]|uniref:acetyl-CoA carboxylase biotin carboxyl carrier protein n=1 Tax=Falsiroseomonas sp. E2-1-a20 TaxID=3239300 RepID=UPI003F32E39D
MSGVRFDADAIRELAKILRETDLTEIELVEKDSRIRVARQVTVQAVAHVPAAAAPAAVAAPVAAVSAAEADAAHPGLVTSPMVGVAYLSPEPGAAAFVTLGAKVAQGQTLMLIEAMKTFNQIRAPRAGTVTRILVDGGSPVEYGEPLMIIE